MFALADQLVIELYAATAEFGAEERYGLKAQLRRAGVSVATNIVEGCARAGTAEYRRFVDVSHASARECSYLLSLAARLGLLRPSDLPGRYDELAGRLLALSLSLRDRD